MPTETTETTDGVREACRKCNTLKGLCHDTRAECIKNKCPIAKIAECDCDPTSDRLLVHRETEIICDTLTYYRGQGVSIADLEAFAGSVSEVIFPWDPVYNSVRLNFNKRFNYFPVAIVFAKRNRDIMRTLGFAQRHGIPLAIRGGSHCSEFFSLTSGIIIDQSCRKGVTVHDDAHTVEVEAGVTNGILATSLREHGVTVPGGTCATVSVCGLCLGAGLGFAMRKYGLTADSLLELDIILADGTQLTCNETKNSDLFWACRGAGNGNFGIVTRLVFRTIKVKRVTIFKFTWRWSQMRAVVKRWQRIVPTAPDGLVSQLFLDRVSLESEPVVAMIGQFIGSRTEFAEIIKHFLRGIEPATSMIQYVPYIDAVKFFSVPNNNLVYYKDKNVFAFALLSDEVLDVFDRFVNKVSTNVYSKFSVANRRVSLWSMGGRVSAVKSDATAFWSRQALFLVQNETAWDGNANSAVNFDWVTSLFDRIRPLISEFSYANLADLGLGASYLRAYYGDNVERLIRVKRRYDPDNVFRFPQSIPVRMPVIHESDDDSTGLDN